MDLPLNNDNLPEGFYWGIHEVTVDEGPRIRLPAAIVRTLAEHKVRELWLYPDPTRPGLIICPDSSRAQYIKLIQQYPSSGLERIDAYRRFICTGERMEFRHHGRLSLTTTFHPRLRIARGEQVVILGTGLWYELWRQDDWLAKDPMPRTPS